MSIIHLSNQRDPLRVSTENARYFTDKSGRPVYLAGFHTWYNVQDGGASDPPAAFDWNEFVAAVQAKGCNFIRMWTLENSQWWPSDNTQIFYPPRYERTGPGNAADGKLKFDLTKINPAWLDRLYSRVADCASRNIYCGVMLFNGFNVSDKGSTYNPAAYHPYILANNINSVDGDQDNDGMLLETETDTNNVVLSYQEALIEAVIDRLNDLDNVIWEICNEPTGSSGQNNWVSTLIDYIHTYEAGKPKQHPVWYTVAYPNGSNTDIDASSAEAASYNATVADTVVSGTKVSIYDTDHTTGGDNTFAWVWSSFCEGHGGALDMDLWDTGSDYRSDPNYEIERANCGYAVTLARLLKYMNLMTPQAALCNTGFCLAHDHATAAEYVCFQSGTGNFTLNLSTATGTLNIRWLRCSDGTVSTGTASGGATRTLSPPWTGAVVAYVYH